MRVIISAGGTSGHIDPAVAIINKIKEKEPDSEFLYIGTHNRMEKDIIPSLGINFVSVEMYGFNRENLFKNFKVAAKFISAKMKCKKIIKKFNPDIVIGVGGYITVPVILAAYELGIKTFIHEQNSVAGKANLFLANYTNLIGVSFKSSKAEFPKKKTIITGNPVSELAINDIPYTKEELGLDKDKKLVLIVMGSLGSSKINDILSTGLSKFANKSYEVLFITGKNNFDEISALTLPNNVKVKPFINSLWRLFSSVDVLVTRAGASTISELIALKVPSILIPSPYVPNNHQYKNALDLINEKAAILIEEKNLTMDNLITEIDSLIVDSNKVASIKNNLASLDSGSSATIIYENIRKLVDRK